MTLPAMIAIVCCNPAHQPKEAFIENVARSNDGRWRTSEVRWTTEDGEVVRSRKTMTYLGADNKPTSRQEAIYGGDRVFDPLGARRVFSFRCPLSLASPKLKCSAVSVRGERLDQVLDDWFTDNGMRVAMPLKYLAARVSSSSTD